MQQEYISISHFMAGDPFKI